MFVKGKGSVYEQIVERYQKFISLGVIKPKEKLPSCRELSIELGVNLKTVERAYNELINLGLVQSIPKKGYFVMDKNNDDSNSFVKDIIIKLKKEGVSKEMILKYVDIVYGKENENDRN